MKISLSRIKLSVLPGLSEVGNLSIAFVFFIIAALYCLLLGYVIIPRKKKDAGNRQKEIRLLRVGGLIVLITNIFILLTKLLG